VGAKTRLVAVCRLARSIPRASVHIIAGAAGCDEHSDDFNGGPPGNWSAVRLGRSMGTGNCACGTHPTPPGSRSVPRRGLFTKSRSITKSRRRSLTLWHRRRAITGIFDAQPRRSWIGRATAIRIWSKAVPRKKIDADTQLNGSALSQVQRARRAGGGGG
jgi:hypothetical protein